MYGFTVKAIIKRKILLTVVVMAFMIPSLRFSYVQAYISELINHQFPSSLQIGQTSQSSIGSEAGIVLASTQVAAGKDFATEVLGDPWDMSEFSDVSQGFNDYGQRENIRNPLFENGIFSGTSATNLLDNQNAKFLLLFPSFPEGMKIGKLGLHYPINSSEYRCFYAAMKVDSGPFIAGVGPDRFRVLWYADDTFETGGRPWGVGLEDLYPEAAQAQPSHYWKLHKMQLDEPSLSAFSAWTSADLWQGLRLDPTTQAVNFAIDWVRLTDCNATFETISFTPNTAVTSLWVKPSNNDNFIRVANDVAGSSGSYRLDVQGIAPGGYTIGLGTETTCCISQSSDTLTINQTPIVRFSKPSYTSGPDYATTAGNTWDFSDGSDIDQLLNAPGTTENGVLDLTTPPGSLPAGVDVQIFLNSPAVAPLTTYRYVSIRMYTEWGSPWQDVITGMIGRWMWTIPSQSGGSTPCTLVSQDIAHDVGWHTYHIDLFDYFSGAAEETYPRSGSDCPPINHSDPQDPPRDPTTNPAHWLNSGSAIGFRYDPNENVSCDFDNPFIACSNYRQLIDWIALTAMDSVLQGQVYEVKMDLNKALDDDSFTLYYTTDPAVPNQNLAEQFTTTPSTPIPTPIASDYLYIPWVASPAVDTGIVSTPNIFEPATENPVSFLWDTSQVTPSIYYICAQVDDGLNSIVRCSEAPLAVIAS